MQNTEYFIHLITGSYNAYSHIKIKTKNAHLKQLQKSSSQYGQLYHQSVLMYHSTDTATFLTYASMYLASSYRKT